MSDHGNAQLASRADLDLHAEFAGVGPADDAQVGRLSTVDMFGPSPAGVTQSPPIQVMGKSEEAYRIPSSVFERTKSNAPMEWSVASNESLFSIHVGNSSFSRDHVFLMGRSGELDGRLPPMPPMPDATPKKPEAKENLENSTANAEAMKEVMKANAEQQSKADSPVSVVTPHSVSRRSDGSGTSIRSFAFPILTEGRNGSVKGEGEHPADQKQAAQPAAAATAAEAAPAPAPATGNFG
ncbi:hypothetical protein ACLOJK_035619 [Asimina triloba]